MSTPVELEKMRRRAEAAETKMIEVVSAVRTAQGLLALLEPRRPEDQRRLDLAKRHLNRVHRGPS